jgi:hypothetical protein
VRDRIGGPAPEPLRLALDSSAQTVASLKSQNNARKSRRANAAQTLDTAFAALLKD